MSVVLARVGWWRQTLVSDRMIRFLAWGLAAFFLSHGLVSFAEGGAGIVGVVDVSPGRARDRSAHARRGRLGRSLAALARNAPDVAVALSSKIRESAIGGGSSVSPGGSRD